MYAFISIYSSDNDVAVYLFDTEEEAIEMLRQTYKNELQNDIDCGHEHKAIISADGRIAKIINYRRNGKVVNTTYRIGCIYE